MCNVITLPLLAPLWQLGIVSVFIIIITATATTTTIISKALVSR